MFQPGEMIAGWEVDEVLGESTTTGVYLCHRDVLPDKRAVLRVLLDAGDVDDIEQRFLDQAQAYSRVDHPNLAKLLDARIDGGLWFLVTEYVDGTPLDQVIEAKGALETRQVVDYLTQIAGAVVAAAQQGLHHTDLKPGNILVTDDGSLRVVDFGNILPKRAGPLINSGGLTRETVLYTPPEWLSRQPQPLKWDLYSIGVLTYTLLTGSEPELPSGPGSDQQRLLQEAAHKAQAPFFDPGTAYPGPLRDLVRWLTRVSPADRPDDAAEILHALDDYLDATEVAVRPQSQGPITEPEFIGPPSDEVTFDEVTVPMREGLLDAMTEAALNTKSADEPPPNPIPQYRPAPPPEPEPDDSISMGWGIPVVLGAAVAGAVGASAITAVVMVLTVLPMVTQGEGEALAAPAPSRAVAAADEVAPTDPAPKTAAAPTAPAPAAPPPEPAGPKIEADELPSDFDKRTDRKKAFLAIDPPEGEKVDVYFLRDGEAPAKLPWKAPWSNRERGLRPFYPDAVRGIKVVNTKSGIEEVWDPHDLQAGKAQRWVVAKP